MKELKILSQDHPIYLYVGITINLSCFILFQVYTIMYEIGRNPDPNSIGPVEISSGLASTSFPRHEEARPFLLMASSPAPSIRSNSTSLSTLSRDASSEKDANDNFESHYSTIKSPSGASGVHPGEGNIFKFTQNEGSGPVRLTHMTPISPTNEDVYSSEQLQRNPQPPISVCSL